MTGALAIEGRGLSTVSTSRTHPGGTRIADLMVERVAGLHAESIARISRARARARYEVLGRIAGTPVSAWPHRWSPVLSSRVDELIVAREQMDYPELSLRFSATRTGSDLHVVLTLARALDVIESLRVGRVSVTLWPAKEWPASKSGDFRPLVPRPLAR